MNKIIAVIVFLIFTSVPPSEVFTFEGPLQVKNQFPLFIYVNAPYLESALMEDSFSASLSYSSIYMVRESQEWSMGLDMEATELNLRLKKKVKDFLEIGIDIPLVSFNSGFMDGFVNSYHDAFGFPDYGRSSRPDNEFLFEVKRNDVVIIEGNGGNVNIGDIKLAIKKPILYTDPALSIEGFIELPSGNAKDGYGNGSIDTGIAILFDKKLGEKVNTYFNIGAVFPGNLKGHETIDLREYIYGGAGVEAFPLNNLSLLGQIFLQGSPYPVTEISAVDRTAVLLSLGGRYIFNKNILELSFTEDPNTAGAPDFAFNFSFKRRF